MKAHLFFESHIEFISFLLEINGTEIRSYDKEKESIYTTLSRITEVDVGNTRYAVSPLSEVVEPSFSFTLVNFMINEVQKEHEVVWITLQDRNTMQGMAAVEEYLRANILEESFVLRIGWRTDYFELLFTLK